MDQLLTLLVVDLQALFWDRIEQSVQLKIMIVNRDFYRILFPRIICPLACIVTVPKDSQSLKRVYYRDLFLTSNYGKRRKDLGKGLTLSEVLKKWSFKCKKHIEGDLCLLEDRETYWLKLAQEE